MKDVLYILLIISVFSCSSIPKNFTFHNENKYTGLDQLIDINGYYVAQRACDSTFYSIFRFYPNGQFTIATTSKIFPELIECMEKGGKSTICKYPLWGFYRIKGDTIQTQVIRTEGSSYVIFRDYLILPNKNIVNISDYVEPQYSNLGYLKNYPSFKNNPCGKSAKFYSVSTKSEELK